MTTIKHSEMEGVLQNLVDGCEESALTVEEALQLFEKFIFGFDIEGFTKESDQDMALYQCGVHDWGEGEKLEFDFVRQIYFMEGEDDDDDEEYMKQLHFTLYFDADIVSDDVAYHIWYDLAKGKDEWMDSIRQSEGFMKIEGVRTAEYKISYEDV
ncbi:MAG: hypothetical protein ABIG32_02270 [Candidatus Uhrbacteria bacterium]|nr:hypothetical protein [Patescibacteria group bacterium]MBU1907001.1 hypothetical protein [Patescibacteria group bacterium]